MSDIVFQDVHLTRGSIPVLRGLDLAVDAGETLALVGRSGAGKSTILKVINRLLVQDRGEVIVRGRPTQDWDPFDLRRHIGYVLQDVGLFPHLTVRDVAVFRLLGWPEPKIVAGERLLTSSSAGSDTFQPPAAGAVRNSGSVSASPARSRGSATPADGRAVRRADPVAGGCVGSSATSSRVGRPS